MKKLINFVTAATLLAVLVVVPAGVSAQDGGVIEVGGGQSSAAPAPTKTLPSTGGSEAPAPAPAPATPNTGIAPSENKVLQNTRVFAGGGALGIVLGFGLISIRKKNL